MTSVESTSVVASRPGKIQPAQLQRLAVVYIRQSTAQQVLDHRESTALQYALRERAIAWGWSSQRVLVIDEDLGQSGSSIEGRSGFQRLLAEVSLDHVGLVLGIEMSRLARSCKDWHQLLEVCALFAVLLADQDGLYDPREYNDRLLLGLKGTLSEAELHMLRQRMHQGRLNKARRGELFNHAPIGYMRTAAGELVMDPDEQVQAVVRLIFEQFEQLSTINAVLQYLVRHDLCLPVRCFSGADRGQLQWRRPNRQTLRNLLHHPIYAGAYTWGRRAVDPRKKIPGRPSTGRTVVPPEQCQVLIKDHCPAYISWSQYQANQQRIADNQARSRTRGAPRQGPALLAGLVVCGRCGRRMTVQYDRMAVAGTGRRSRYACARGASEYGQKLCQSLAGKTLEALVQRQVLRALEPASLELSLAATEKLEQERATLNRHWQQRLERARYQTDRAARQYHAVEPDNRLVARELERQWEQKLTEDRSLQEQYDRFQAEQSATLDESDRQMIRSLAEDIPALWNSTCTRNADRCQVVRHLLDRIIVTVVGQSQHADVTIHWTGGYTSEHTITRVVARYDQLDDYDKLVQRIEQLRSQGCTARQIAEQINHEGYKPPKRRATFNSGMIRTLISRYRRTQRRAKAVAAHQLGPGEWWFTDLARHLNMPQPTLYSWLRRGWIRGRQLPVAGGRWILWADAEEIDRLKRLRQCPKTWHNQPQAVDLTQPKSQPEIS